MRVGGNLRIPRGAQVISVNDTTRIITLDKVISATGLTSITLYGVDNPTYLRQGARFGIAFGTPEYSDDDDNTLATFTGSPSAADVSRTEGTYNDIAPSSTDGAGTGLKFNASVAAGGVATFTLVSGGISVEVADTFTFNDSLFASGGGAAIVLTAATVSSVGDDTARSVRQVSAGRTPMKETYSGSTYGNSNEEIYYGYRVHVRMKDAQEVYTIRNAIISAHTVSMSADGVSEETLELKSGVMPIMYTGSTGTFYSALTTAGEV